MTNRQTPAGAFPAFRAAPERLWRAVRWLWRKLWRPVAIVLAVLIIAHLALNIAASRRLERELARLRAEGAPLTVAEAAPPRVPEAQNPAPLYEKAFARLDHDKDRLAIRAFVTPEGLPRIRGPRPTLAQMEAILARHEGDFRSLERASRRPVARFPMDCEHRPQVLFSYPAGLRNATLFLCAKALVDSQRGRASDALDDLAIATRMSNQISPDAPLIAELVRIANTAIVFNALTQALAAAPPSRAECRAFYDVLGQVDMMNPWVNAMQAERAYGLYVFDYVRRQRSAALVSSLFGGPEPRGFWRRIVQRAVTSRWAVVKALWSPLLKLDEVYYLRHMQRVVGLAGLPYRQSEEALHRLERRAERVPWYAIVSMHNLPVFIRATEVRDKGIALVGLMQAALALRDYQIRHGAYPASLEQLREAGGWAIPQDPFSGKSPIYHREGAGYLIYSVGPDLQDNGGIGPAEALKKARRPASARTVAYDLPLRMTR